jgi:hypothetical protein
MRDLARVERLAIAGRVDLPAVRLGLEQIQRVDERIVLAQIDQPAIVGRIAQRDSYPPDGSREADVGRLGRGNDESRIHGRSAHGGDVERAVGIFELVDRTGQLVEVDRCARGHREDFR